MTRPATIDVITLGCSKNLVDSERLMAQLAARGYRVTHDSERPRGRIAVVNTCGFIADAQEESVNMILELAERKRRGKLDRLYVMGCLSERFRADLTEELPEVDKYYGKFDWPQLLTDLGHAWDPTMRHQRTLTTPGHYAYVKISEGCDRHCGYCAIPIITGRHTSRPMDDIVDEVRHLVSCGVVELQVIAQELTYYGIDLYGERKIAELVRRMARVPGVRWVRLHYAYPTDFPMELLAVMREEPTVCKYLDIALQHISDPVLAAMRRHITAAQTRQLIADMRRQVPGIHLRTTLMVGHPGESDEAFEELLAFVREARFERMGAFAYSEEAGTPSARRYADDIPPEVKQARLTRLMRLQQGISAEVQAQKVGQTLAVMIDREEGDYYVGRTEYDSPEVDPEVLIPRDGSLRPGQMVTAVIDNADDFDLYAHTI